MFPNFAIYIFLHINVYIFTLVSNVIRLDHCDHAPTSTSIESGTKQDKKC